MADEQRSDDNTTPDGRGTEPEAGSQPQSPAQDATEVIPAGDATAALPPPVDPYIDYSETQVIRPSDQAGEPAPAGADATVVRPSDEEVWSGRAEVRPAEPELRDGTPPPSDVPAGSPRWWTPLLLGLLALLLLAAVIFGVWLSLRDNEPTPLPSPSPTSAPATSAAPSPSPIPSPSVLPSSPAALVVVPADLIGKTSEQAVDALIAAGLSPSLAFQPSDEPEGTVIAVDPAPGSQVPAGAQVGLTIAVAKPSPSPSVSAVSPSPSS